MLDSNKKAQKLLLGDRIKQATSAVGIKPCRGCEERAAMLNEWSRRSIVKTGFFACLAFLGGFKNSTLKTLWQVAGKTVPASFDQAIAFTRMFMGIEIWFYGQANRHTNSDAVITTMIAHREHFKGLSEEGKAWMRMVKLQEEVLPGWKIDFALAKPIGPYTDGYRMVLSSTDGKLSILTDDDGVIYVTTQKPPRAELITGVRYVPGAQELKDYEARKIGALERIINFFQPTVHAQGGCCGNSNCAQGCGALQCVEGCCGLGCADTYPTRGVYCFFPTGYGDCRYAEGSCNNFACNCCQQQYFNKLLTCLPTGGCRNICDCPSC